MRLLIRVAALLSVLPASYGAVGDVVSSSSTYFVDGVIDVIPTNSVINSVDREFSPRYYDSTKAGPWTIPYSDGTEGDSLMCWSHAATNSLQYWQDVYGVFYNDKGYMAKFGMSAARTLPNGTIGTEDYYGATVPNARQLEIAKSIYTSGRPDRGGKFGEATEWFLKRDYTTYYEEKQSNGSVYKWTISPGGYYSNYFGNNSSYISIYSEYLQTLDSIGTTSGYTPFANGDIGELTETLLPGFGLEKQSDGSYVQTQQGMLPFIGIWYDKTEEQEDGSTKTFSYGHMVSAYGFTLDDAGNIKSLLLVNGDDKATTWEQVYLKVNEAGKMQLYFDADYKTEWLNKAYYIGEVSYINTPEVLQKMLAEYQSADEALVWNGGASEWKSEAHGVELPTEAAGWDVLVDGEDIAEEHHGYYHSYGADGRAVRFDSHGTKREITIVGTVAPGDIEVAEGAYTFKAGEAAVLAGSGRLTVRSGASLSSELVVTGRAVTVESGASLRAERVAVVGDFSALQAATTYSLREAVVPEQAVVAAELDLTAADSLIMETSVSLDGNDLLLRSGSALTMSVDADRVNYLFTDIDTLSIDGTQQRSFSESASAYFTAENLEGYRLVYAAPAGTLALIHNSLLIPEPTTATLGLVALVALAARRRRR